MNAFEKRLRSLKPPPPSAALRERIFGTEAPSRTGRSPRSRLGLPLPWAAALALSTGLAGLLVGRSLPSGSVASDADPASSVTIRIVDAPSQRHVFDLSRPRPAPSLGPWKVNVSIEDEG